MTVKEMKRLLSKYNDSANVWIAGPLYADTNVPKACFVDDSPVEKIEQENGIVFIFSASSIGEENED